MKSERELLPATIPTFQHYMDLRCNHSAEITREAKFDEIPHHAMISAVYPRVKLQKDLQNPWISSWEPMTWRMAGWVLARSRPESETQQDSAVFHGPTAHFTGRFGKNLEKPGNDLHTLDKTEKHTLNLLWLGWLESHPSKKVMEWGWFWMGSPN